MSSTFGTYSVAYSGMYVNQASLAVTSTNLANVNTTGASKVQAANTELSTVQSGGMSTGDGVSVASITRSRDILLDSTYRSQNAKATYDSVKSGNLEYMDEILTEYDTTSTSDDTSTTTSGVQAAINDFFDAWNTLSTDSSTESTRKAVEDAGVALIEVLTSVDEQLQQLQADAVTGVKDGVKDLNDLATQVAALNTQITQAESGGGEASYLRDQRDALLDQMSAYADISVNESGGKLTVTLGGVNLVNGNTTNTLEVKGSGTTSNPLTVQWADSDTKATINSGSIKAYLEDATDQTDFKAVSTSSIPYSFVTTSTTGNSSISTMRQSLDDLITTLAIKVNALQTSGVDQNGDAGEAFFTTVDASQPLSISNIQVNPNLVADEIGAKIVAASSDEDGNNTIANAVYALYTDTSCYESDGSALDITDFYKALTSWLGTAGDQAASSYTEQAVLVAQVDAKRQSVSAISIDEEMSNMIKFQNAYAASARVMSTIDGLIGDLIAEFD